jgi:anti-sigma factor RsiW
MRPDEMLRRALDGELDAKGKRRLEKLLESRPELQKEYERLSGLKGELGQIPRPEPAGELPDRVMEEILSQRRSLARFGRPRVRWFARLGYAAATAAACAVSAWLGYAASQRSGDLSGWVPAITPRLQADRPAVKVAVYPPAKDACRKGTRVRFVLKAPGARSVSVVGDFNGWSAKTHSMRDEDGDGIWTLTVNLRPPV